MKMIHLRLPDELHAKLQEAAQKEYRSMTAHLTMLIEKAEGELSKKAAEIIGAIEVRPTKGGYSGSAPVNQPKRPKGPGENWNPPKIVPRRQG